MKNYIICIAILLIMLYPISNACSLQYASESIDSIDARMFLTLKTDKTRVSVDEPISVSVKLFVNKVNLRDIVMPALVQNDLSVAKFEDPVQYREVINNVSYDVLEFKTKIFGTKPGVYKIGPAKIACNVAVKSSYSNIDSEYQYIPFDLSSQAIEVSISKNGRMLDVVIAIFGFAVGIFVVVKLFKPIVKMTVLSIYRSVKKKNAGLSEKELLKRTVQKRYALAFKGCPREEIINAIDYGTISNIDELLKYMLDIECEGCARGSARKDREMFKNLKWQEHLAASWPMILIFLGGAIGGVLGVVAYVVNVRIFNKKISTVKKYIFSVLVGVASVLVYFIAILIIAIAFPELFKKP